MTATDELRRLLDERGVEWTYGDGTVSYASDGRWFHAWAYSDDTMCVSMGYLTPAQAVEATLGSDLLAENAKLRELCRDMYEDIVCGCAECFFSEYDEHRGKPSECSNCGCGYRQIADRMMELEVDA